MRVVRAAAEFLAAPGRIAPRGEGRLRRRRDGARALRRAAAARRGAGAGRRRRARPSTCSSASARSSAATRRWSRRRPAPRSTRRAARGAVRGGRGGGAGGRIRERGHRGVPARPGRRVLLPEMNTRLQVEHPVTECSPASTSCACRSRSRPGRPLPFAQDDVVGRGHALECRLYAEDPARGDLPSPGRVLHSRPPEGPGMRFDAGSPPAPRSPSTTIRCSPRSSPGARPRAESIERMAAALRAHGGARRGHEPRAAAGDRRPSRVPRRRRCTPVSSTSTSPDARRGAARPPPEAVAAAVAASRRRAARDGGRRQPRRRSLDGRGRVAAGRMRRLLCGTTRGARDATVEVTVDGEAPVDVGRRRRAFVVRDRTTRGETVPLRARRRRRSTSSGAAPPTCCRRRRRPPAAHAPRRGRPRSAHAGQGHQGQRDAGQTRWRAARSCWSSRP